MRGIKFVFITLTKISLNVLRIQFRPPSLILLLWSYGRGFEDHIVLMQPIIRKEDMWIKHEAEFLEWFRSKVSVLRI